MREEGTAVAAAAGDLVRRYADAGARDDFETMEALRHHEWQEAWPQSGEIVTSNANYRVVRMQRPEGAPRVEPGRVGGSRACWWSEAIVHYADGSRWLAVSVYELRGGLVWRERIYFGQPVTAPAWRALWVGERSRQSRRPTDSREEPSSSPPAPFDRLIPATAMAAPLARGVPRTLRARI